MLVQVNHSNEKDLYDYFCAIGKQIPYYFPVDFHVWKDSMFCDCDYDGMPLFAELKTYILVHDELIKGFIQFGMSAFIFAENGNKDYNSHYYMIRNFHFQQGTSDYHELLDKAAEYFDANEIKDRYAFFHYFGMSCYARQGKLHETGFYIENALNEYAFNKEHENIYYSRTLEQETADIQTNIIFSFDNNEQSITFIREGENVGGCELYFLAQGKVCFLKWIYIMDKYIHQGLGTKCMKLLFAFLRQKGICQLDTDTADNNINAQNYYLKTGFIDKGRMRSYFTL